MGAHLVNVLPDKNSGVMGQRISLDGREMQQNGLVQFSRSIELDLKSSTHRALRGGCQIIVVYDPDRRKLINLQTAALLFMG